MEAPDQTASLHRFIGQTELRDLIQRAKTEDMGPDGVDLTSRCLVGPDHTCRAHLRTRQAGRLAGAALLGSIVDVYDPAVTLRTLVQDGQPLEAGETIAELNGPLRSVLAMERVALNFATHLSGIATLTGRYVAAAGRASGIARICDTRKTLPGLRSLQKYAVVCGGGHSHRHGLYDAVLIKDNHIAHLSTAVLAQALQQACQTARGITPSPRFIEVEVDTLEQLRVVLGMAVGNVDMVLLDNMSNDQLLEAVSIRDRMAPGVQLEASGRVDLDTVEAIARTGVDRISVGQITHSAPALDLALDIS